MPAGKNVRNGETIKLGCKTLFICCFDNLPPMVFKAEEDQFDSSKHIGETLDNPFILSP